MNDFEFVEIVKTHFKQAGRELPWREPLMKDQHVAYKILVSEFMLQQTQVSRVVPKYKAFVRTFPEAASLAQANLKEVLTLWQGLGYNRRALYLHEASKGLQSHKKWDIELLHAQKGIGYNTAAAVCVYAYNQPHVFIETNIRTVYLHHYFPDQEHVGDKSLLPVIERTLDMQNPREWYWALMDYGSYLKKTHTNPSRRSSEHRPQTTFEGSFRQLRATLLRQILASGKELVELAELSGDSRVEEALKSLEKDGIITRIAGKYEVL